MTEIYEFSKKVDEKPIPENPVIRSITGAANDDCYDPPKRTFLRDAYNLSPVPDKNVVYRGAATALGMGIALAEFSYGQYQKSRQNKGLDRRI